MAHYIIAVVGENHEDDFYKFADCEADCSYTVTKCCKYWNGKKCINESKGMYDYGSKVNDEQGFYLLDRTRKSQCKMSQLDFEKLYFSEIIINGEWKEQFKDEALKTLPPDTLITLYDYHL